MDPAAIICILIIVIIIIGFGISVAVIYSERNHYVPSGTECPVPPQLSQVIAEKQLLDQWHWQYNVKEYGAYFQQYCPTNEHDVNVFVGGKFAARSDGKILTVTSTTYIRDCHGKIKYTTRTGNAFQTFINGNGIFVSFELRLGGNNGPIVAYADEKNFFSNDVKIKDINGNLVTEMNRNLVTISPYSWQYNIHNTSHPAGDIVMLMTISGKISFSNTGEGNSNNNNNTDMCNGYFWSVAWIVLTLACFIACVVIVVICYVLVFTEHAVADYFSRHLHCGRFCNNLKNCFSRNNSPKVYSENYMNNF